MANEPQSNVDINLEDVRRIADEFNRLKTIVESFELATSRIDSSGIERLNSFFANLGNTVRGSEKELQKLSTIIYRIDKLMQTLAVNSSGNIGTNIRKTMGEITKMISAVNAEVARTQAAASQAARSTGRGGRGGSRARIDESSVELITPAPVQSAPRQSYGFQAIRTAPTFYAFDSRSGEKRPLTQKEQRDAARAAAGGGGTTGGSGIGFHTPRQNESYEDTMNSMSEEHRKKALKFAESNISSNPAAALMDAEQHMAEIERLVKQYKRTLDKFGNRAVQEVIEYERAIKELQEIYEVSAAGARKIYNAAKKHTPNYPEHKTLDATNITPQMQESKFRASLSRRDKQIADWGIMTDEQRAASLSSAQDESNFAKAKTAARQKAKEQREQESNAVMLSSKWKRWDIAWAKLTPERRVEVQQDKMAEARFEMAREMEKRAKQAEAQQIKEINSARRRLQSPEEKDIISAKVLGIEGAIRLQEKADREHQRLVTQAENADMPQTLRVQKRQELLDPETLEKHNAERERLRKDQIVKKQIGGGYQDFDELVADFRSLDEERQNLITERLQNQGNRRYFGRDKPKRQEQEQRQKQREERAARQEEQARIYADRDFSVGSSPLGHAFGVAGYRSLAYGAIGYGTYSAINSMKESISILTEVEQKLTTLRKLLDPVKTDFNAMAQSMFDMAKASGRGFAEVGDVMGSLARQGRPPEEMLKLTQDALLMGNIGDIAPEEGVKMLVAILAQFNMEAEKSAEIIDKLNNVSNKNAVSFASLAEAIVQTGAAFETQGGDFDEMLAVITALSKATQLSGSVMGRSLRRMFQNINNPKFQTQLNKIGVSTQNEQGGLRSPYEIMGDISKKWKTMADQQREDISRTIGGGIYKSYFAAMMNNWSAAEKALGDSLNAEGSAYKENAEYMKTYEAKLKQTQAAWAELVQFIGEQGLLDWLKSLSELSRDIAESSAMRSTAAWALNSSPSRDATGIIGAASLGLPFLTKGLGIPGAETWKHTQDMQAASRVANAGMLAQFQNLLKVRNMKAAGKSADEIAEATTGLLDISTLFSDLKTSLKNLNWSAIGAAGAIAALAIAAMAWREHVKKIDKGQSEGASAMKTMRFSGSDYARALEEYGDATPENEAARRQGLLRAYRNYKESIDAFSKSDISIGNFGDKRNAEIVSRMNEGIGFRTGKNDMEVFVPDVGYIPLSQYNKLSKEQKARTVDYRQQELIKSQMENIKYLNSVETPDKMFTGGGGTLLRMLAGGGGGKLDKAMISDFQTPEEVKKQIREGLANGKNVGVDAIEMAKILYEDYTNNTIDLLKDSPFKGEREKAAKFAADMPDIKADFDAKQKEAIDTMVSQAKFASSVGVSKEDIMYSFFGGPNGIKSEAAKEAIKKSFVVNDDNITIDAYLDDLEEIKKLNDEIENQHKLELSYLDEKKSKLEAITQLYLKESQITKDMNAQVRASTVFSVQTAIAGKQKTLEDMLASNKSFIGEGVDADGVPYSIYNPAPNSALADIDRQIIAKQNELAVAPEDKKAQINKEIERLEQAKSQHIENYKNNLKEVDNLQIELNALQEKSNGLLGENLSYIDDTIASMLGLSGATEGFSKLIQNAAGDTFRLLENFNSVALSLDKINRQRALLGGVRQGSALGGQADSLFMDAQKQKSDFIGSQYDEYIKNYQDALLQKKTIEAKLFSLSKTDVTGTVAEGDTDKLRAQYEEALKQLEPIIRTYADKASSWLSMYMTSIVDSTIIEMTVNIRKSISDIEKEMEKASIAQASSFGINLGISGVMESVGLTAGDEGFKTYTDNLADRIAAASETASSGRQQIAEAYFEAMEAINTAMVENQNLGRNKMTGTEALVEQIQKLYLMDANLLGQLEQLVSAQTLLQSAKKTESIFINLNRSIDEFSNVTTSSGKLQSIVSSRPFGDFASNIYGMPDEATMNLLQTYLQAYLKLQEDISATQTRINNTTSNDITNKQLQLMLLGQQKEKADELYEAIRATTEVAAGLKIDTAFSETSRKMSMDAFGMLASGELSGFSGMQKVSDMYKESFQTMATTMAKEGGAEIRTALMRYLTGESVSSATQGLSKADIDRFQKLDELRTGAKLSFNQNRMNEALLNAPTTLREKMPTALEIMKASGFGVSMEDERPVEDLTDAIVKYIPQLTAALIGTGGVDKLNIQTDKFNPLMYLPINTPTLTNPILNTPMSGGTDISNLTPSVDYLAKTIEVQFPKLVEAINNLMLTYNNNNRGYAPNVNNVSMPTPQPQPYQTQNGVYRGKR